LNEIGQVVWALLHDMTDMRKIIYVIRIYFSNRTWKGKTI